MNVDIGERDALVCEGDRLCVITEHGTTIPLSWGGLADYAKWLIRNQHRVFGKPLNPTEAEALERLSNLTL